MPLLPVFVKLEGRRALVVGGGTVGLQKVQGLLDCAAKVTVIAPEACGGIRDLAEQGKVIWMKHKYESGDLAGHLLVIAATNDAEANHTVYEDAVRAGVLANVVDDPTYCDFYFGSIVRRGPLQIGISTAGESPAFAQRLREQLELLLDEETGPWLEWLGELRREVLTVYPPGDDRNLLLRKLATREICDSPTCPSRVMAVGAASQSQGFRA